MTEIKNTKWLNKEVQISLVCEHIQDDTKENKTLKFKNQNKKIVTEVNNKFEDHINLIEEDNFLLNSKETKSDIHQGPCKKNNNHEKHETAVFIKKTAPTNMSQESNAITKQKQPKKIVLELRPEYSIKKNKNPALQELDCDNPKVFQSLKTKKKRPGKVVLELRQEPTNNMIKTSTPILAQEANSIDSRLLPSTKMSNKEVLIEPINKIIETTSPNLTRVQKDNDDDSRCLLSNPFINSEEKVSFNEDIFEVDEVGKGYVFKSIIQIENNSLPSNYYPVLPSKDNPYSCCGHTFYHPLEVKLHKESHRKKKSYHHNTRQFPLNNSANLKKLETCEKPKKSNLYNTQNSLITDSINVAAINNSFDRVNESDNSDVLNFSSTDSVDYIVENVFLKKKLLIENLMKKLQFTCSNKVYLTTDKNCDEQNESYQCGNTQQIANSDAADLATKRKDITDQHATQNFSSTTATNSIANKKSKKSNNFHRCDSQPFSSFDFVDLTINENRNNNKMSDPCDSQQLSLCNSINLTAKKNNCDTPNKTDHCVTQQLSISSSANIAINNENFDEQNKSYQCSNTQRLANSDAADLATKTQDITDQHVTQNFSSTTATNSIVNKKSKKSSNFHRCDSQPFPFFNIVDLPTNENSVNQKISDPCDSQQLSLCNSINLTAKNNNCVTPNKTDHCVTQQLSISGSANIAINNENFDEQNKSYQCGNTQRLANSDAADLATKTQDITDQHVTQKFSSTTTTNSIANKKCNESINFYQCDSQPFPFFNIVDLPTNENSVSQKISDPCDSQQLLLCNSISLTAKNNHCDMLNKTDHSVTQQLISDSAIIAENNKNCDKQKESYYCNTQNLSIPVTINLIHNKCDDEKKKLEYEQQASDAIDLLSNQMNNEKNKIVQYNTQQLSISYAKDLVLNECDKQNTSLQQNTHQLEVCDTIEDKVDQQTKSHLCDSQESLVSYATNLVKNINCDEQNKFDNFNYCELSFSDKLVMTFRKNLKKCKKNLYKCNTCQLSFFASFEFMDHIKLHEMKKKYSCQYCKQKFSVKSKLAVHMKTHYVQKHYECNVCKQTFFKKSGFVCHVKTHTGYKLFKCTKCKMSFNKKSFFLFHKRSHNTETTNECHLCLKVFKLESSLKRHLVMHSKEISFQCNTCKMHFNKKSNLILHVQTHNKAEAERNTHNSCKMSFVTSFKQSNRIKTCKGNTKCQRKACNHAVKTVHQCEVCKMSFKTLSSLSNHIKKHKNKYPKH